MTAGRPLRDLSDDALLGVLCKAIDEAEPVPQKVIDQANAAYAAHQLRVGGDAHAHAVAAPDTKPPTGVGAPAGEGTSDKPPASGGPVEGPGVETPDDVRPDAWLHGRPAT